VNLLAAWCGQGFCSICCFHFLTAEELDRRATEQRAVNLLAHLVERGLAQSEEFAVQEAKACESVKAMILIHSSATAATGW
jgi:hypothetical protein